MSPHLAIIYHLCQDEGPSVSCLGFAHGLAPTCLTSCLLMISPHGQLLTWMQRGAARF